MATPDAQTAREIARKHIRSGRADIGTTIARHFGNAVLGDEEFAEWEHEVTKAWYGELRTVLWSDEQEQDEQNEDEGYVPTLEYGALNDSTRDLIAAVTSHVTAKEVSADFPDDSDLDDPFAMIAEDAPDGPAYAVAEHWFSHAALISDSVGGPEWHAIADMTRRILDLMDAEQAERGSGS